MRGSSERKEGNNFTWTVIESRGREKEKAILLGEIYRGQKKQEGVKLFHGKSQRRKTL